MAITARPARAWVSGVVSCLALFGPATGALGAEASAASAGPLAAASAGRPSVPAPGAFSYLFSVSCTSSVNCWAVGDYGIAVGGAVLNQALHWNGRSWSRVSTPDPGGTTGTDSSILAGVSCTSPTSCWAVGGYNARNTGLNQVLHWNGRKWSLVPAPEPGTSSDLLGVRCTSPGNCWAVGTYQKGTSFAAAILTLALHWNGRKWSLVSSPSPGGAADHDRSELNGLRCASPGDCWAVGDYGTVANGASPGTSLNLALHWNGRKWSLVTTTDPGGSASGAFNVLSGVSCPSPGNCWAVGQYSIGSPGQASAFLNDALHWNGRMWSQVHTPNPDGTQPGAQNVLSDASCTSSANCWAVGSFGNDSGGGVAVNQAMHWNGRTWIVVFTPDPGTAFGDFNALYSIRCTSPANCWAVGVSIPSGQPSRNQALHWNGSRWSVG